MPVHDSFDVIIAGGGPAGTSAAIHLVRAGARVLLVEQKKFPRQKLCGEFISPECRSHFARLGVDAKMVDSRGVSLTKTVFYSRNGRSVAVPSAWFGGEAMALGLSRAEMDHNLLQTARKAGVVVLEQAQVSGLIMDQNVVRGIRVAFADATAAYRAFVTVDATGRSRALARRLDEKRKSVRGAPRLVAFKTHLEHSRVADGACEIYFYPGGYGGLNCIEDGLSNVCFICSAEILRHCGSRAEVVLREVVCRNSRAAFTLKTARSRDEWLAVTFNGFGPQTAVPGVGLLAIGDAAAFIDPFTGSGILMALENGELVAQTIISHLERLRAGQLWETFASDYANRYRRQFHARMRISALLRRVAFVPQCAEAAILLFGSSDGVRRRLAQATRTGEKPVAV